MPLRSLSEEEFIGRNPELTSLYNSASEAQHGRATSIFLSGPAGIGKTELLKQLFSRLFWQQNKVVPFFYTISPFFNSLHDFSADYLNKFIRQWLAFQKKDISFIQTNELSLERLKRCAEKSDAHWAVDIIGNFNETMISGNETDLFFSAINAPELRYQNTGIPVIVIIDNFHKTKNLYGSHAEHSKNVWKLFEEPIKSRYTPHIITGNRGELHDMLFQQTSFGEVMELFEISGLDNSNSLLLFTSLCERHNITVDAEGVILPFVDQFNNNPFYIKNFIQTARHAGKKLTWDNLWKVYFNEISSGKFLTFWLSRLKKNILRLDLRKVILEILYHLCSNGTPNTAPAIARMFAVSTEDLNDIINFFQETGIIEMNFSIFNIVQDRVLTDVIKVLYNIEVLRKALSTIEDELITDGYKKDLYRYVKTEEKPSFEITMPVIPKAELIAVNALEQIAKNQHIAAELIQQLNIALIDLFISIKPRKDKLYSGNYFLKFEPLEDTFTIDVKTPYKELISSTSIDALSENQLLRRYTDDIKIEETKSGIHITLIKKLKRDLLSAS
jgi:hypothetical protein